MIAAAVGSYFKGGFVKPVSLLVDYDFHRAAPGGTGWVKAAGNYSPVGIGADCWQLLQTLRKICCVKGPKLAIRGLPVVQDAILARLLPLCHGRSVVILENAAP